MKRSMIYFIILLSFLISSITAQNSLKKALDDPSLTLYRRIPDGLCKTVFVVDTFMYMGNGAAVDIYGISDPANPHKLGRLLTPSVVKKIFVKDNLAFIAEMKHGIFIANVTNPAEPELVGSYKYYNYSHPDGLAEDVFAEGNYAYIAYGVEGLRVIDVSNPSNPTDVGVILNDNKNLTYAYAVDVVGNYAYVANGGYGMSVIDVSNPDSMSQVGSYENSGVYPKVNDICVVDTMAYLSTDWSGLTVVNISDPTNPFEVGSYNPGNITISVFAEGDYAYITQAPAYGASDTTVGLTVLNVSDPYDITDAGEYITEGHPYSAFAKDSLEFIADGNSLLLLNSNSLLNTKSTFKYFSIQRSITSSVNTLGETKECFGVGLNKTLGGVTGLGLKYWVGDFGLMLDLGMGVGKTDPVVHAVSQNNHVYYVHNNIIEILDWNIPSTEINVNGAPEGYHNIGVSVRELFVVSIASNSGGNYGFMVGKRYEENNPGIWGELSMGPSLSTYPTAICTKGNFIFILTQNLGPATLEVFDASDIKNIKKVSSTEINSSSMINSIECCGDKLVFSGSSPYVQNKEYIGVIDVSNLSDPKFLIERSFEGNGDCVKCLDASGKVVVAEGENGVSIFDVSDPNNIKRLENQKTGDLAQNVTVSKNKPYSQGNVLNDLVKTTSDSALYIFVADGGDGAYIYKYDKVTGIQENHNIPNEFELFQNYPNPFPSNGGTCNPATTIKYSIPSVIANPDEIGMKQSTGNSAIANNSTDCRASLRSARNDNTNVTLKVYDMLGREVATLVNKKQAPGSYEVMFNAGNLPSGIYFYRLQTGSSTSGSRKGFVRVKKMLLLK